MPKLTYTPQTPDDPENVTTHSVSFEKGKAVTVSDAVYEKLKDNPWFQGSKGKEAAEAAMSGGEPESRPSGIDVAYPPGSGDKYPGAEYVKTSDGMVPGDEASDVDGANVVEDEPKRRGRPPGNR